MIFLKPFFFGRKVFYALDFIEEFQNAAFKFRGIDKGISNDYFSVLIEEEKFVVEVFEKSFSDA